MSRGNGTPTWPARSSKIKKYYPKTKTGCQTCRIRRVKCSEEKPDCQRCTSTGRKCDGYFDTLSPASESSTCSPQGAITFDPASTALEKKTFEWFRYQTVPILSGHFADETYCRTALQMYFSEPAIRYAITAFGALHLELFATSKARLAGVDSNLRTHLPAEQYSRALQKLQALLALDDFCIEIILVCSILLTPLEALLQDFMPAMLHAEKALSLLSSRECEIEESLLRTMMRFDAQSAMHVGRKAPRLTAHTSHLDRTLPPAFTSAVVARHWVMNWSSRLYAFSQAVADHYLLEPGNVALEHLAQAHEIEHVFARIGSLLNAFQPERSESFTARERHGLQILRARTKILRIFAATCLYSEATMFDTYLADFRDILDICTGLMNDASADRRLFVLHVDEGLLYPLYIVATYCRDSEIRHKAYDLMRELPSGNGLRIWHADVVIRTAKVIVDYEEAGEHGLRCEDVPEWRRVHNASFENWNMASWDSAIGGPLRVRPNGVDGEWMDLHELLRPGTMQRVEDMPQRTAPLNVGVIA